MDRPSSVDKLPPAVRDEIGRLRGSGFTIDDILAALRELDVTHISRSSLGRHLKNMEKVGRKLRQSRTVAEALVRQLGDAPASRSAQLNIELLHSVILDLQMAGDEDEPDADGLAALKGNPEGIMLLAKAIDHLTKSSKTDADFVAQIEARTEARMRAETKQNVAAFAKSQGLSADVKTEMMKAFGVQ